MTTDEAIKTLEDHNKWRRGGNIEQTDPKELGVAIDLVLDEVRRNRAEGVHIYFSSKEELTNYISRRIPIAIRPTRPANTMFVNLFTSHNARKVVEDVVVVKGLSTVKISLSSVVWFCASLTVNLIEYVPLETNVVFQNAKTLSTTELFEEFITVQFVG